MHAPAPPSDRAGLLLVAAKCDHPGQAKAGEASYCVLPEPAGEARARPRQRTRLRSGKLVGLDNRFLAECHIYDRSPLGARIRLLAPTKVPQTLRLFEDADNSLIDARLVWDKGCDVGLRFTQHAGARPPRPAERAMLAGKYYATGGKS